MSIQQEIEKVLRGDVAYLNLIALSKKTGYHRDRLVDLCREAGLTVRSDLPLDNYKAYKETYAKRIRSK